ncbi:MAG: NUDIX domain-containing protein [Candidatus Izemoplasmatales bacterium]
MAEKWELYDKDRQRTGVVINRGEEVPKGYFHTVVHICIFNQQGQMLIQQRQPFKESWSNLWDVTVGGSAVMGDTSRQAAEREVFEELGLKIDLSNQTPTFTFRFSFGFDDVYVITEDVDIHSLHLQYEEVKQVAWATKQQIFDMIDDGRFIDYHKSFIEIIFNLHETKDIHTSFARK